MGPGSPELRMRCRPGPARMAVSSPHTPDGSGAGRPGRDVRRSAVATHPSDRSQPATPPPAEPTFALRAVLPFLQLLVKRNLLPRSFLESFEKTRPYDRIALRTALSMLDNGVALSGDPDLGLYAALQVRGDAPLLEYVSVSRSTMRE